LLTRSLRRVSRAGLVLSNSDLWASRDGTTGNLSALDYGNKYAIICGMTSVEELIEAAADARRIAQKAIELAVREARAADWSWDQISAALGGKPNGETLRRKFAPASSGPTPR
jgi:hypothetical protein